MAPCFSGVVLTVVRPDQELTDGAGIHTSSWRPFAWRHELLEPDVSVLLCSGIYPFLWGMLRGYGIQVVPDACGDPAQVLHNWRSGVLSAPRQWPLYAGKPGVSRRRHRFRGGRES